MLTDEQLIEQIRTRLRAELAELDPPADLLDRLGEEPARRRRWFGRLHAPGPPVPGHPPIPRTGALLTAIASVAAIVVAVAAIALIGHRGGETGSATPVPAGARALVAELGVLRRPQTAADRAFNSSRFLRHGPPERPQIIPGLTRLARTLSDGEKIFLFVTRPAASNPEGGDGLGVFTENPGGRGGGGGFGLNAATILHDMTPGFASGSSLHPGVTFASVVPDDVARVRWVFPRQSNSAFARTPGIARSPVYPRPVTVYATVHSNIAAARVNREPGDTASMVTWYAADGRVLKTYGSAKNLNRVVPAPKPRPKTALSRRAERDPSTPNPLRVTPTTGSKHTAFNVKFEVLLNGGLYHFIVSGGPHRGCAPSYGGDDYGGNYLRGQTFSIGITPRESGWCAGTYRVTAAYDGPSPAHGPYPPFGHVTFTVR